MLVTLRIGFEWWWDVEDDDVDILFVGSDLTHHWDDDELDDCDGDESNSVFTSRDNGLWWWVLLLLLLFELLLLLVLYAILNK